MLFTDDLLIPFCAGKMSNIRALGNKANQKVSGQGSASRKRDERRDKTADAWFPVRVDDEPNKEEEIPLKRKRISSADKSKQVQTQTLGPPQGASSAGDGLFKLL